MSRSSRATTRIGPFGAKEASEGALAGTSPAIVAAVAAATGLQLDRLPVTPDSILDAWTERRRRARLDALRKGAK